MFQSSSLFTIVLGMAASFLALSVLIQIVQELYKYLFKSKSAAYRQVLFDMIGTQATSLWNAPETADFRVRGPWDLFRSKPGGILLPLGKEELGEALTRTAPPWVNRLLAQIEQEKAGKSSGSESATWSAFLKRLGETEKGTTGYWVAREIAGLLVEFGHTWTEGVDNLGVITTETSLDVAKLETAARQKFLPHVDKAKADFPLIERNMEYAYKRRNMRQSFVIALIVCLLMSFPIQRIYQSAEALTDDQAVAMAEQVMNIYEKQAELETSEGTTDSLWAERQRQDMDKLYQILTGRLGIQTASEADSTKSAKSTMSTDSTNSADSTQTGKENTSPDLIRAPILTEVFWNKEPLEWLGYILGCLVTAVLLSFGASFWNDVAKSVLNFKNSMEPAAPTKESAQKGSVN